MSEDRRLRIIFSDGRHTVGSLILRVVFARRAAWDLSPNPLSLCVAARRASGQTVIDLSDANPTRCGIESPGRALREALQAVAADPGALRYEPDPRGDAEARAAIARYHARGAATPDADQVLLTAGSSEGYSHLFRLLADPGDRVHLPVPGYGLFTHLAEFEGLEVSPYLLRPAGSSPDSGWRIDLDQLAAGLSDRSRAIVVIDPHNPTGSFVHPEDRASLESLAAERGLALISDEVFADFARAPVPHSSATIRAEPAGLRFVLSGASKVLGLPQLKVAWLVASGPPALRDEALGRLEFVSDAFLSVSPIASRMLPALFGHREVIAAEIHGRITANRERLEETVRQSGAFEVLPAEAGWAAIVRVHGGRAGRHHRVAGSAFDSIDEETLALALVERQGVIVQPGFLFDLESRDAHGDPCGHFVLSLLAEPARFEAGVAGLAREFERVATPR